MNRLRRLGRHGPMVSPIGLGCMSMSGAYGPADDDTSVAAIRRALELGVSHLDTSASYGRGHNETVVGRAIAGRRDGVVLATKFGIRRESGPRDIAAQLLPLCRELGIGVVAYSPMGSGLLTGNIMQANNLDQRQRDEPRLAPGNLERNLALVEGLATIARRIGSTPAQLALAWVLAQGDDIVAVPGTKRVSYLEENAAAAAISLGPELLEQIDALAPPGAVAGHRHGPAHAAFVGH